jgi:hypothetical protein
LLLYYQVELLVASISLLWVWLLILNRWIEAIFIRNMQKNFKFSVFWLDFIASNFSCDFD